MSIEQPLGLVKLTGAIANYKATRAEASFVFTDNDRNAMGVIAIAVAIAGLSGPAIATAANANATEEDADYVEFDLDGKAVKGWVWRSPFKEGDGVEVAAEWRGDHYETAAIARPEDRTIALYPHCSRGKAIHAKNAAKWWLLATSLLLAFSIPFIFLVGILSGVDNIVRMNLLRDVFPYVCLFIYAFFGLMTFSLSHKWMPFVRLAEKVFKTLGMPDPSNVDLVKSTKAQRKPDDPGELGTFYFRY